MRNGRKPQRDRDRAFEVASSVGRPQVETHDLTALTPQAADEPPSLQLGLDSLDPLDEPAELLIRVSSETLEGDSDLVDDGGNGDDDDDEIENLTGHERVAAEAAIVEAVEVGEPLEADEPVEDGESVEAGEAVEAVEVVEPLEADETTEVADVTIAVELPAEMPAGDLEATPDAVAETPQNLIEPAAQSDEEPAAQSDEEPAAQSDEEPAGPPVEPDASEVVSEDFEQGAGGVPKDVVEEEAPSEALGVEAEVGVRTAELSARPLPYEPAEPVPFDDPVLQMRLARIHLKTGSLTIARAELEALAARNQLDTPAHLDLAEARWRTGDLDGAGEAAGAYMEGGGDEALGLVIAAEASAMANRHAEARRHTEQALERNLSELDPVFAGIPRRAVWALPAWSAAATDAAAAFVAPEAAEPVDSAAEPVEPVEPEAEPVEPVEPEAEPVERAEPVEPEVERAEPVEPEVERAEPVEPEVAEPVESAAEPAELAVMLVQPEAEAEPPAETPAAEAAPHDVQATAEVASGRSYLEAGDPMMAALHFGVAIRLAPALASAVLDGIGDRQELPLQLLRGDALRLLGLEGDAGRAYQSVASALGGPKPAPPEPTAPASIEPEPPAEPALPQPQTEPDLPAASAEPPPIRWG
jgi:tetratricopeptide (TPR) repeat protein